VNYSLLDHVGFAVSDLDRSVEWHTFLLGEPPPLQKTWEIEYVGRIVGYPGVTLEGRCGGFPAAPCSNSCGTTIPTRRWSTWRRTTSATRTSASSLTTSRRSSIGFGTAPDSAPRSRSRSPGGRTGGGKACYLRNPDGITIELLEAPPGGPSFD
jgi:hypothetical protein